MTKQTSRKKKIALFHGKTTLSAVLTKVLSEASNCPPVDFGERGTAIQKVEWDGDKVVIGNVPEKDFYINTLSPDFSVSEREQALNDRVAIYYKQTPDEMSNHQAKYYSRELHKWLRECGYTQKEFVTAKKNYWMMKDKTDG